MLIEFSVTNFLTMRQPATLSMVAAKLHASETSRDAVFSPAGYPDIPLLRSAVIYGANASGKTNLLRAFGLFRNMILNSTDVKYGEQIEFHPFALSRTSLSEPTVFEMEFVAQDDVRYIYGFAYNETEILEEHLYSFANNNRQTEVFSRTQGQPIKFGSSFRGPKKSLEEQLQHNHLLLTKAANNNFEQFHPIYRYFAANLPTLSFKFDNASFTKQKAFLDPAFREKIIQFLRQADTGIEAIHVRQKYGGHFSQAENIGEKAEGGSLDPDFYLTSVVHHMPDQDGHEPVEWPIERESAGTIRLFALAGPIIEVLSKGTVLILDELNTHFHPSISEMVLQLFNHAQTNPLNAQLIFTTHDVTLLNKDNFRRDQIWFIEKNENHDARLFPLSAFDKKEVRWDVPFDKWYLSGRFGAIPSIGEIDFGRP